MVVKSLIVDVIVGFDFLRRCRLSLNCGNFILTTNGGPTFTENAPPTERFSSSSLSSTSLSQTHSRLQLLDRRSLERVARQDSLAIQAAWVSFDRADITVSSLLKLPSHLEPYADVFDEHRCQKLPVLNPETAMAIELHPDALPVLPSFPYKLSLKEEEALKAELSTAAGGCPVMFVRKGESGLRMCIDYRKLNTVTKAAQALLPSIEDILGSLPPKLALLTNIDLRGAFNQLRLTPDSEALSAFVTKFGKFHYRVIPLGLRNAPSHFQVVMLKLFHDLVGNGLWVYVDDILIYEQDPVRHRWIIHQALERLRIMVSLLPRQMCFRSV